MYVDNFIVNMIDYNNARVFHILSRILPKLKYYNTHDNVSYRFITENISFAHIILGVYTITYLS